jgi:hypothetical protein
MVLRREFSRMSVPGISADALFQVYHTGISFDTDFVQPTLRVSLF